MPFNDSENMRSFMTVAEMYSVETDADAYILAEEEAIETAPTSGVEAIMADLKDAVFKLRAFCETESGDYALGVEMGMQRAADMIENIIRRYGGEVDIG